MLNSLTIQYLFQTPDCHTISITEGYLSGCVSGISPVLELGQCVLVDKTIVSKTSPSNAVVPQAEYDSAQPTANSATTKNRRTRVARQPRHREMSVERNISDVLNRSRFIAAVPLEVF